MHTLSTINNIVILFNYSKITDEVNNLELIRKQGDKQKSNIIYLNY